MHAKLRLPAIISDHAMLQEGKPVAIWGWASPTAQVKVTFVGSGAEDSAHFEATADASGKWSGHLPALSSGATGEIQVTSDKDGEESVHDVLVGEVWLGSGQSNMVYSVGGDWVNTKDPREVAQVAQNAIAAQKEAGELKQPIRYFGVVGGERTILEMMSQVIGCWLMPITSKASPLSLGTLQSLFREN